MRLDSDDSQTMRAVFGPASTTTPYRIDAPMAPVSNQYWTRSPTTKRGVGVRVCMVWLVVVWLVARREPGRVDLLRRFLRAGEIGVEHADAKAQRVNATASGARPIVAVGAHDGVGQRESRRRFHGRIGGNVATREGQNFLQVHGVSFRVGSLMRWKD